MLVYNVSGIYESKGQLVSFEQGVPLHAKTR